MSGIRERARAHADGIYEDCRDADMFVEGFLAAHEQLPGREEISMTALKALAKRGEVTGRTVDDCSAIADAILALIRGGQS